MVSNPERRTALVDAAIEILAREGARGLTFRAVDSEAGVPAGTATNYFTNRDDLVDQVGRRIHVRLAPGHGELAVLEDAKPSRELVVQAMRSLVHRVVTERTGYLALLELRLESTRRPALRETLTSTVRANHERDVRGHEELGMPGDRMTVLMLYLAIGGLITEQLTLPGMLTPHDTDAIIADLVTHLVPEE